MTQDEVQGYIFITGLLTGAGMMTGRGMG